MNNSNSLHDNSSTKDEKNNTLMQKAIGKNGLILALFALVSTGLIAITYQITKDKIAQEIKAALARRLNEIVPANEYDNDAYHDCTIIMNGSLLGQTEPVPLYRMRNNTQNYAVFTTAIAPEGYSGRIHLAIGIYQNGQVAGVRVTEHSETPGLGDRIEIEKSDWIMQYSGKSLQQPEPEKWRVKKDGGEFDALTGATITPRAITKAVYNALLFYQENSANLFNGQQNCGIQQ
ncbi:electron transport complex subunit RsxG [Aliikangiella maris]|uniref:Ion-translocating oxidoreductase complex subunit G n=2 Tax=Aliikangiella maris TaxID=3162458 RepID=A0ABV2BPG6_9GAMM